MIEIITLVENTAIRGGLKAEHGLSMLIKRSGDALLWDTGQTDALLHNARLLGVDLGGIDKVALSHGHYDHAGGLEYLLDIASPTVFAHPEIFRKRYSRLSYDGNLRYIGIKDREFYESKGAHFHLTDKPVEVMDGIFVLGYEQMHTDFEEVDKNFVYEKEGELLKDDVPDDTSLVIEMQNGIFILFGCAHRGIINIIDHAEAIFGRRVVGFLGGTHLGPASSYQRNRTIEELRKRSYITTIGANHCTGMLMTSRLYCEFPDRVVFNNAGSVFRLDEFATF